jgi:DNA invertase Pin-like site-specific DNA recombinase
MPPANQQPATAYSYLRFSSKQQARGDSIRRQEEARDAWCERHRGKVTLDATLSLKDQGGSAFTGEHRKNPDRHALASFLRLVEQGRIAKGSYLLVESLDRLSREDAVPALHLFLGLLTAGVRIVQLQPVEMVYDARSEPMQIMMAIMELSRGNSESRMKSERVGGAWREKKKNAARKPLTAMCPAWMRLVGGEYRLIDRHAQTVREIFRLCRSGYGVTATAKKLNEDGVPTMGKGKHWAMSYVAYILTNRAVIGEYQPHTRKNGRRVRDGDPVAGYFPAVISEKEFLAARACAADRKRKPGRPPSGAVHLFSGLLRDARSGGAIHLRGSKKSDHRQMIAARVRDHKTRQVSFSDDVFEAAVLSLLKEIDPREILNGDSGPDETLTLAGELAGVETELAAAAAFMDGHGFSPTIGKRIAALDARKADLAGRLAAARQKAANPLTEAWGEAKTLLDALDGAPDPRDARLRLRGALRRIAESIWLLIVPRGRDRVCAVQVIFAGGKRCRSYLILSRTASFQRKSSWLAHSLAEVVQPGDLDLRQPAHALRLVERLEVLDLPTL